MSAAEVLERARADGMRLWLEPPERVRFRGPQLMIEKWTPIFKRHKPGLVMLLRSAAWGAADWRAYFDERAAIAEFDGAIPRAKAEQQAYQCCVAEWLCRNPVTSEPGQCAWCNRGDMPGRAVLPYGDAIHRHTHLHGECWAAWWAHRRHAAIAALKAMGIHEGRQRA